MVHPQVAGKLIAVEGLDGSGKSTQVYLLKRWLESEGVRVYYTEWNSSQIVRMATKKGKKRKLLTPTTFSLIHATDFGDRYERQILPLLQAGYVVLADRYMYTAFARDVVRGCDPEWVRSVYSYAVRPDITFYFQTPLETALTRILAGRPTLKFHEAGMDLGISPDPYESFRVFQGRILREYETMKEEFSFRVIDATRPIREQHYVVREIIRNLIDLPSFVSAAEAR
jgi:dTMP kinase